MTNDLPPGMRRDATFRAGPAVRGYVDRVLDRDVKPENVLRLLGPDGAPLEAEAKRSCGSCQACCSVLGVHGVPGHREDEKPPHSRCAHQAPGGCAIYATRPAPCKAYVCGWLAGLVGDGDGAAHRPDRLGVIFDRPKEGGAIRAREVFRGGFERARAKETLKAVFASGRGVVLKPYKGRKLPTGAPL